MFDSGARLASRDAILATFAVRRLTSCRFLLRWSIMSRCLGHSYDLPEKILEFVELPRSTAQNEHYSVLSKPMNISTDDLLVSSGTRSRCRSGPD